MKPAYTSAAALFSASILSLVFLTPLANASESDLEASDILSLVVNHQPCPRCAYPTYDEEQSQIVLRVVGNYQDLGEWERQLLDEHPGRVRLETARFTASEMDAAFEEARQIMRNDPSVYQIGLNTLDERIDLKTSEHRPMLSGISGANGAAVPFYFEQDEGAESLGGRRDDYPRYWMGGSLYPLFSGGRPCSLGIPVRVNGASGVLTAGHCGTGRFRTIEGRKAFVGSTYTTSYPGNAAKYGDWQILHGSTYNNEMFTTPGGSTASNHATIVGVNKGALLAGKEICFSGQVSGSTCGYTVSKPRLERKIDGVVTGQLTEVTKQGTCFATNGDSGGTAYYPSSHGVVATGILTAGGPGWTTCTYYYTRLSGILAWNHTTKFPGE